MRMLAILALLLAAQAGGFQREQQSAALHFRYGWPAEAQAIPALRRELRRRMDSAFAEAMADARETRASAREAQVPFYPQLYSEMWSVEAGNARFLSLTADRRTDQNGAHPNRDFEALIWDRARGGIATVAGLIGAGRLAAMGPRFCAGLAAILAGRGAGPGRCPPLAERVLALSDRDGNGRFDALHVLIAPYVAASYADGSFVVDVPFAPADLAGLAPADRGLFEAR
jgi:hypothetical protein